ncbi:DUF6612 family protein [Clostridium cylindrosporum]|uniref:Lipoprotein n=1 Tax=Clostridium cylindrosporum DSM 605 TaxID=1121307 RepID=A0A0J8D4R0_CLOCY|nr:DUF6612 family protein [Clostridium cylindrosporum]KMT21150.1 hypothetical protein CLCY_1c03840 [Clostridium cylindrosporum DSM 605]
MTKIKISIITAITIIFSLTLIGCSSSPEKVLSDALTKNKGITYSKQDTDISIGLAGMGVDIKAKGEIDSKSQKSSMKVSAKSPLLQGKDISIDIYSDKNIIYVKDPESDQYLKMNSNNGEKSITEIGSTMASGLASVLKDDTKVKESLKLKNGDNSDKVVSAEISGETVTKLIDKAIASQSVFTAMESAVESQLISMAETQGVGSVNKEEIQKSAKEEAKKAVEEYKTLIKNLKFQNVKYTGKINKDGYLYGEELSFNVSEASSGMTLNIKIITKLSDINSGKSVNIPSIPADKITNL